MTEVKGINSSQCVGDIGSHDESEGINSNQYVGGTGEGMTEVKGIKYRETVTLLASLFPH